MIQPLANQRRKISLDVAIVRNCANVIGSMSSPGGCLASSLRQVLRFAQICAMPCSSLKLPSKGRTLSRYCHQTYHLLQNHVSPHSCYQNRQEVNPYPSSPPSLSGHRPCSHRYTNTTTTNSPLKAVPVLRRARFPVHPRGCSSLCRRKDRCLSFVGGNTLAQVNSPAVAELTI